MKKFIFLIALLTLLPLGRAHADTATRVVLEDVIGYRNIILHNPQTEEKVVIHVKPGCGTLVKNQMATLVIQGDLNGNYDSLKIDELRKCPIDQVEPLTQKLYVHPFTTETSEVWVTDEANQDFLLRYTSLCERLPQFQRDFVFVFQGGNELAAGDRLILPELQGACSIERISPRIGTPLGLPQAAEPLLPTAVSGLKAILGNGSVTLKWNPALDSKGISHYLISTSPNAIDPKGVPTQDMPALTTSSSTQTTVTGLENGQSYFFYVAAVNLSGNQSSDWVSVQATPSAQIQTPSTDATTGLGLKLSSQSAYTFTVRWNRLPGTTRQTVDLTVDGRRMLWNSNFTRITILLRKGADRKGKSMVFRVRAYGIYGLMKEESLELKF